MFSLQVPINSTSLGQVSTNLLYEIYKKGLEPNIFVIGQPDLSSFNGLLPNEFSQWLQSCTQGALSKFKRSEPSLRLWHINDSQDSVSNNPFLYFFHELDNITPTEANILKSFEGCFNPSSYTTKICESACVKNVETVHLGYNDVAFKPVPVQKYEGDPVVITIAGKYEKRKRTGEMINILAEKYGNKSGFKIHLHVFNPFYDRNNQERCGAINQKLVVDACGGQIPWNFNLLPHFPCLTDLNKAYNMADVVVDGSGGESWSLPAFHMAGLGKQCVVHGNSGILEWANSENSIIVDPCSKIPAEDGMFFGKDSPFNSGNIYDFDRDEMVSAIDVAVKRGKAENTEGLKLRKNFTNEKMCEEILGKMQV